MNRHDLLHSNSASPALDEARVLELIAAELSPRARLATTAMLLAALLVTIMVASLWLTEPALPLRTQWAFGLIVAAGLGWSGWFGYTLLNRRTRYLQHRVASATLAVFVCALFTVGACVLAWLEPTQRAVGLSAATLGMPLLIGAITLRVRVGRQLATLRQRRDALAAARQ